MQRFTTFIVTKKGEVKRVSVEVDDITASVLKELKDESSVQEYLAGEYKFHMIERRETRRHISLESIIEQGSDLEVYPIEDYEKKTYIKQAVERLTPAQKEIITLYFYEGITQSEIAKMKGISHVAVHKILQRALLQIKKYL